MDLKKLTPAEMIISIAGIVMIIFSFLKWYGPFNAWDGDFLFPLITLLPIYGLVMALQIILTKLANVKLPDRVLGFSWAQVHMAMGLHAAAMGLSMVAGLENKKIGATVNILGSFALVIGAFMLRRERETSF